MVPGCQAGTRLIGGRNGTTEAGERPASFVCRDVACVYRTERGDKSSSKTEGPGGTRRTSAAGTRPSSAVGVKRRQVQLEGSRATYNHGWQLRRGDRALGKEDRTGSPARPSSLLEGECHGTTLREVP